MKAEDLESGTVVAEKVFELKKEIERIAKTICRKDDSEEETLAQAIKIFGSWAELRSKKKQEVHSSPEVKATSVEVPETFKCPISKEIMYDPVILASGQTYDRTSIKKWLSAGNLTCPTTDKLLKNLTLTPNNLVQNLISRWCEETENALIPKPTLEVVDANTHVDRDYLNLLFDMISVSHASCCEAVKELRHLTKTTPFIRKLFGESKLVITQLVTEDSVNKALIDRILQEDLMTTIFNVAIHEDNKNFVMRCKLVNQLLGDCLGCEGRSTSVAKRSAAATLFTLSVLHENKVTLAANDFLIDLIDFLTVGDSLAVKDAVSALISLCNDLDNKEDVLFYETVDIIVEHIKDRKFVDELLPLLANLSYHPLALRSLEETVDVLPCLLDVISESACEVTKEHCIVVIYNMCYYDKAHLRTLTDQPNGFDTIMNLTYNGTSTARRLATSLNICIGTEGSELLDF